MLKLLEIADKLKGVASSLSGIKASSLGVNSAIPSTPAAEIIVADFDLHTLAAGANSELDKVRFQVVFYVAMTANLEDDERTLIPIVEGFVNTLIAEDFDFTLGGLVEDVRPTRADFDLVQRNNRWYRYAAVEVYAGQLDDSV